MSSNLDGVLDNKNQENKTTSDDYTQQKDNNLGRLIRTLSEKCFCGKPLQLRTRKEKQMQRGEEITVEIDYKCCSALCGYEEETEQKKRKNTFDKTALRKEDLEIRDHRRGKNGCLQRQRTGDDSGAKSAHRPEKRYRRNTQRF